MILSGMVNNVTMMRPHAALAPTLHHGSVWAFLIARVMRAHAALAPTFHHGSVWPFLILSTSDVIEVRMCRDQDATDEDTPIQLLSSAATNISKEEHEMKKTVSPQEIHQQTQINQSSTDTHGFQKQTQEGAFKTTTKGIIFTLLIMLALSVIISLAVIVLSILSYVHVERNVSQLSTQLDVVYRFALSVQPEAIRMHCGAGLWYPVAHLNMTDPSQQCPSAWREVTMDGIRVCARPNSTEGSCPGVLYHASYQYSKVCGRVIGYQFGSPDAFARGVINSFTIDEAYIEGVSITHGYNPRKHIWSYAAGSSEINRQDHCSWINCPCNGGYEPPSYYVGSNYYCESVHYLRLLLGYK